MTWRTTASCCSGGRWGARWRYTWRRQTRARCGRGEGRAQRRACMHACGRKGEPRLDGRCRRRPLPFRWFASAPTNPHPNPNPKPMTLSPPPPPDHRERLFVGGGHGSAGAAPPGARHRQRAPHELAGDEQVEERGGAAQDHRRPAAADGVAARALRLDGFGVGAVAL